MGFDRSQALTNANSKCLRIERIVNDRARPATERMALIAAIVEEYETGVPEWARDTTPRPEYPASAPMPDPCETNHPDAGCADVGCTHNCEAWASGRAAERERAALVEDCAAATLSEPPC